MLHVVVDGVPVLLLAVADQLRPAAPRFVNELKRAGVAPALLTGDILPVAKVVAAKCGIDAGEIMASLKPEDKLQWVKTKQGPQGGRKVVAMLGDGINDSPALTAADVGIAMGAGGTALAVKAADVVILKDSLMHVAAVIRLSKACRAVIIQNIVMAVVLKLAVLVLAVAGLVPLWAAVLADVGSLLLVLANGTRLLGSANTMPAADADSGDSGASGGGSSSKAAAPPKAGSRGSALTPLIGSGGQVVSYQATNIQPESASLN